MGAPSQGKLHYNKATFGYSMDIRLNEYPNLLCVRSDMSEAREPITLDSDHEDPIIDQVNDVTLISIEPLRPKSRASIFPLHPPAPVRAQRPSAIARRVTV